MRFAASVALAIWSAAALTAQFAALPQADSPEEFDAYLSVLSAQTPATVISAADEFVRAWPRSGLRGHVFELQFEAYREQGDTSRAIAAAEKSLQVMPDNLVVLANLPVVLATGTSDPARLARAEAYARKVLALTKSFRLPKFITPEDWAQTEARLNSQAHAALGLVANRRGDVAAAIREFESAIALATVPDATQYYRLGMLYRATGNLSGAKQKFQKAAQLDEPKIKELAEQQLRQMEPR